MGMDDRKWYHRVETANKVARDLAIFSVGLLVGGAIVKSGIWFW